MFVTDTKKVEWANKKAKVEAIEQKKEDKKCRRMQEQQLKSKLGCILSVVMSRFEFNR